MATAVAWWRRRRRVWPPLPPPVALAASSAAAGVAALSAVVVAPVARRPWSVGLVPLPLLYYVKYVKIFKNKDLSIYF